MRKQSNDTNKICTDKEQGCFFLIAIRGYSVTFILPSEMNEGNEGKVIPSKMIKSRTRFLEVLRCHGMLPYDLGSKCKEKTYSS